MDFLVVPSPVTTAVPMQGGIWDTLVGVWGYNTTNGWQFIGWDPTNKGYAPLGAIIDRVGDTPSGYALAIARGDADLGIAPVPMPNEVSDFYNVDMPTNLTQAPASPGTAAVGVWVPSVASQTGWSHSAWLSADWDVYPDGHAVELAGATTQLLLVMARTSPDGAPIGIPYNPVAGTLPQPGQPPPGGGGGGGGDSGQDELGECCAAIVAALTAIAAALAAQGPNPQPPDNTACCANIVHELTAIASGLAHLATVLGERLRPLNIEPLVTAINQLATGVTTALANLPAGFEPQAARLESAVVAVANSGARIADEVHALADKFPPDYQDLDAVTRAMLEWLKDKGLMDSELAQTTGA